MNSSLQQLQSEGLVMRAPATTGTQVLPIWTLGDPHKPSRHTSVATRSSFMVAFGSLAQQRRRGGLGQRCIAERFLLDLHARRELTASSSRFRLREARALRMRARDTATGASVVTFGIPGRHEGDPRTADDKLFGSADGSDGRQENCSALPWKQKTTDTMS